MKNLGNSHSIYIANNAKIRRFTLRKACPAEKAKSKLDNLCLQVGRNKAITAFDHTGSSKKRLDVRSMDQNHNEEALHSYKGD